MDHSNMLDIAASYIHFHLTRFLVIAKRAIELDIQWLNSFAFWWRLIFGLATCHCESLSLKLSNKCKKSTVLPLSSVEIIGLFCNQWMENSKNFLVLLICTMLLQCNYSNFSIDFNTIAILFMDSSEITFYFDSCTTLLVVWFIFLFHSFQSSTVGSNAPIGKQIQKTKKFHVRS